MRGAPGRTILPSVEARIGFRGEVYQSATPVPHSSMTGRLKGLPLLEVSLDFFAGAPDGT